jgi:hypothetical protein
VANGECSFWRLMLARQGVGEDRNKRLSFSTTDLRTDARKRVDISRGVLDRLVATADIIAPLGAAVLNSASVSNSLVNYLR